MQSADFDLRSADSLQTRVLLQLRKKRDGQTLPSMQGPFRPHRAVRSRHGLHLHPRRRKTNSQGLQTNLLEPERFERARGSSTQGQVFVVLGVRASLVVRVFVTLWRGPENVKHSDFSSWFSVTRHRVASLPRPVNLPPLPSLTPCRLYPVSHFGCQTCLFRPIFLVSSSFHEKISSFTTILSPSSILIFQTLI